MSTNSNEIVNETINQISNQVEIGNLETLAQIAHLRCYAEKLDISNKDVQKLYYLEAKATQALIDNLHTESVSLMSNISESELNETNAFAKKELRAKIPYLGTCIDFQNNVAQTFVKYVLTADDPTITAMRITQIIRITEQFRNKGNYYMFMIMYSVLTDSNVARLKNIFAMLTKNKMNLFNQFGEIADDLNSYSNLRSAQSNAKYYDTFIPSLPLLLNDLTKSAGEDVPDASLSEEQKKKVSQARQIKKDAAKNKILEEFRIFKTHHDLSLPIAANQRFKLDMFVDQSAANTSSDQLRATAKELEQQGKLSKLSSHTKGIVVNHLISTFTQSKSEKEVNSTPPVSNETPLNLQHTANLNVTAVDKMMAASTEISTNEQSAYREAIINGGIDQALNKLNQNSYAVNKLLLYRNLNDTEEDSRFTEMTDLKLILDMTRLQMVLMKAAKSGNTDVYAKIWSNLNDYKQTLTDLINQNKSRYVKRFVKLCIATDAYNHIGLLELKKRLSFSKNEEVESLINSFYELHQLVYEAATIKLLDDLKPLIKNIDQLRIKIEQLLIHEEYDNFTDRLREALAYDKKSMTQLHQSIAATRDRFMLNQGYVVARPSAVEGVPVLIPVDNSNLEDESVFSDELLKPVAAPLNNFIFLVTTLKDKFDALKNLANSNTTNNEDYQAKIGPIINQVNQIVLQLQQYKEKNLQQLFNAVTNALDTYQKPPLVSPREPNSSENSPRNNLSDTDSESVLPAMQSDLSASSKVQLVEPIEKMPRDEQLATQYSPPQEIIEIQQKIKPLRAKIDDVFKSQNKTILANERTLIISKLNDLMAQLEPYLDKDNYYRLSHLGSGIGAVNINARKFNEEFSKLNEDAKYVFSIYQSLEYLLSKIQDNKIKVIPESKSWFAMLGSAWHKLVNFVGFGSNTVEHESTAKISVVTGMRNKSREKAAEKSVENRTNEPMSRPVALRSAKFGKSATAASSREITDQPRNLFTGKF